MPNSDSDPLRILKKARIFGSAPDPLPPLVWRLGLQNRSGILFVLKLVMQKSRRQPHLSVTLYCLFIIHYWFKFDILLLHCCKLHSLVVNTFAFQPPYPGSIRAWVTSEWNGSTRSIVTVRRSRKGNAWSNLFFAWKPCITGRVRAAMPAWGIAIMRQQLFRL